MLRCCHSLRRLRQSAALSLTCGILLQLGACFPNEIATTSTVTGRDVLLTFLRAFLIAPIDAALVNAVDNVFDNDN